MSDEYDVVKMDFPPYEEEYSALPEPEVTEEPFYKIKEEVYRRNRAIAAEQQTALLKEEERRKAEKREQFREMLEKSKPPAPALPKLRINGLALSIAVIAVFGIFIAAVRKSNTAANAAVSEAFASEVIQYMETERVTTTQAVITETAAAEQDERKFTAVREPFEEDGVSYIYCTSAMSYRFTPSYDEHDGEPCLHINVDVKNLTDYDYIIVPNFNIIKGEYIYIPKVNGEYMILQPDGLFEFDENSLCSFLLEFEHYNVESDGAALDFSTRPFDKTNYAEKCDEDFQIPIRSILKYLT